MNSLGVNDTCFSEACLTFVLAGIFCAIIRWLHVCHPYGGRRADYYYPARRQVTFFFSAIALQFPYILHPSDEATWTYIRAFGVLYYPVCFSMLFRRYFDRHRLYLHWKGIVYIVLPLASLCALGIASQTNPAWVTAHSPEICFFAGVTGFLLTIYFVVVAHKLKKRIDKYHYDNFSCERDFPYLFAQKVLYTPLLWMAAMWVILVTANRWVKFSIDIAFAAWMVLFLAVILHPQRARTVRREPDNCQAEEETTEQPDNECLVEIVEEEGEAEETDAEREAIHHEVASIIGRMYRNPGLRKSDVINSMEYGKKTVAKTYLSEVGFYNFVNAFRLEHARLYRERHPRATLDEVASIAGFRDRFALSHAKAKVKASDRLLIAKYLPKIM